MSKNVLHSVIKPPIPPPVQGQHGGAHPHPAANTAKVSPAPQDQTAHKDKPSTNPPTIQVTPAQGTSKDGRWSITPTRSGSITSGKKSDLEAISTVRHSKNRGTSSDRNILPDLKAYEDAPEIAHLKLMRTNGMQAGSSARDTKKRDQTTPTDKKFRPFASISKCCAVLCPCCHRAPPFDEMDDLEPVTARTRHSLEFIQQLARGELRRSSSITSEKSGGSNKSSGVNANKDQQHKGQAYNAIYEGLTQLHEVHHRYKQLILILTFSRYAEYPLNDVELDLSHSRTVLGSYIWLATYILEQAQYDNDVIYIGYPAADVEEIVKSLESIVVLSVATWRACVKTIENLEQMHENVAHVFTSLVSKFAKEEDKEIQKSRHIRIHSNYQKRAEELDKMKVEYDIRNGGASGHPTWAKFSLAPLRILYKEGKKAATESWRGFELLSQEKKFGLLKILINDGGKIWSVVLEQLEVIAKLLRSGVNIGELHPPKNSGGRFSGLGGAEEIHSFEDGVIHFQKHLELLETTKWNKQEISDFLEVEKITIDNLDLLTLGTATLRKLLYDGRHLVHICYEMTKEMDYLECRQLPTYEQVATRTLDEFDADEHFNKRESVASGASHASGHKTNKKKKRSVFDIEERVLDQKDVETRFDRSIYQDIIKELPVFVNHMSIAMTLQEAEAVFSGSSHAMLMDYTMEE